MLLLPLLVALFTGIQVAVGNIPCAEKQFGDHRFVCVCNTSYCDTIDPVGTLAKGNGVLYVTSRSGKRLQRTALTPSTTANSVKLTIDTTRTFQTIKGFGGAFTDSAGIDMSAINAQMQDSIIKGYYSSTGLGYTIGRVPMASCDFSTHEYSYDNVDGDFALTNFKLTNEDIAYKIPFIKQAVNYAGIFNMKLFATPWSAPGWMKTSGHMKGGGTLKGSLQGNTTYYQTWTNYFLRFFEEYNKQGITFWGLTSQNEPTTGLEKNYEWQTMFFNASMQRDFIKNWLGPALASSSITKNLKLMILDDQRFNLPHWANVVLEDADAAKYVSGIGVHWYGDMYTPNSALYETHLKWPDYFILATEACTAYLPGEAKPILGDWVRAEFYGYDIITDLNDYVTGWTDWNLALDMNGGPNWVNNTVDAPIIIDSANRQYYKQPYWYVIGHFSKFIPVGSILVDDIQLNLGDEIFHVQFKTPQGYRGVVLLNTAEKNHTISINEVNNQKEWYSFELEEKSIATLVFN